MKKKILIIDDSEVSLFLIKSLFEDYEDIEVIMESDSTNAITQIKNNQPDLLILDLMMPKIDGFQILNELKKDDTLNKLPVVIMSAYVNEETRRDLESIGKYYIIDKPVDVEKAEKIVRSFLF